MKALLPTFSCLCSGDAHAMPDGPKQWLQSLHSTAAREVLCSSHVGWALLDLLMRGRSAAVAASHIPAVA
jgi:hypothetical protein